MRHFIACKCRMMCLRDDLKGVTAMEYGLLAVTTVVVGLGAVAALGGDIVAVFATVNATMAAAAG
jgi:Flp pilus assembly pilin Flp